MKKTLANFLLISGFFAISFFSAIDLHAETQPVPELQSHVNDLTGLLKPDQQQALDNKLAIFEQKKGSQVVVLIIQTTEPETLSEYAVRVFNTWKLGREKVDDGVLITLALKDQTMRIDVGYGLEGAIPDAIAKRIIEDVMLPKFKQGDFYGGLIDGTNQVISRIDGEPLPLPNTAKKTGNSSQGYWPLLLIGGMISGLFLRSILGTFFGSVVNGGLIGFIVFFLGAAVTAALSLGFMAFFFTLSAGSRFGGYGGGGFGGRMGGSGGSFSGGGGTFGGGGASGKW